LEFKFITGEKKHIDEIVPFVREEDKLEFKRASGLEVSIALHTSLKTSEKMFAG